MPVIGVLSSGSYDTYKHYVAGFREGLKQVGYVEGQNVSIEYRWADGQYDRLQGLAAELVRRQVTVIVASGGPPPALAARAVTSSIPIVFSSVDDPIKLGLSQASIVPVVTRRGCLCSELNLSQNNWNCCVS